MKVFVGNLSFDLTEEDLRTASEEFGKVESVAIIKDNSSGQSKGFGFIEMSSKEEAQALIDGLNGKELKGRAVNASEAKPRKDNFGGRGNYNKGGFGGNRSGGYDNNKGGFGKRSGGYGNFNTKSRGSNRGG